MLKAIFPKSLNQFKADDSAVTAVEYALIAALIAAVIIASVAGLGKDIENTFTSVGSGMNAAT